jgi:hypothetical protein
MATQKIVEINNLRIKMKVLGELVNNVNSYTITNGVAQIPELKTPKVFSDELLIVYASFVSVAGKLYNKADYDEKQEFYAVLKDTITTLTSKANIASKILDFIGESINSALNGTTGSGTQVLYEENINSLHSEYDADENIVSYNSIDFNNINIASSGLYPVSGVLDGSGNFLVDYFVSPDQTSTINGYKRSPVTCRVNNGELDTSDISGATGYPVTGAAMVALTPSELESLQLFNNINKDKMANFQEFIVAAKQVLETNEAINQADRDKNASLYESAKNSLVNKIQNELNQADLRLNLLAYSQDGKFIIPFLGTINGAQ